MEIAIMIEGQDGLDWARWQRLAQAVEALGFAGLYRSDHYTNAQPPNKDSLECWISLAWLASHTRRIEFGPLVSPVSFRHPTMLARMAGAVDDLSGGRLRLGVGAGWQVREHHNYGWDLLAPRERFDRLEEGVQILAHLLRIPKPLDFQGRYYKLEQAVLLPRPQRTGGPPLVIGGNGRRRTLPLAARHADEWNAVFIGPERFRELNIHLEELLAAQKRPSQSLRRTLMTGLVFTTDAGQLANWGAELYGESSSEELHKRGIIAGGPDRVHAQVQAYADAGVQRLMLQWLALDDLEGLQALAETLLPDFS